MFKLLLILCILFPHTLLPGKNTHRKYQPKGKKPRICLAEMVQYYHDAYAYPEDVEQDSDSEESTESVAREWVKHSTKHVSSGDSDLEDSAIPVVAYSKKQIRMQSDPTDSDSESDFEETPSERAHKNIGLLLRALAAHQNEKESTELNHWMDLVDDTNFLEIESLKNCPYAIPQGAKANGDVFLNLSECDPFTLVPFKEIAQVTKKWGVPFIVGFTLTRNNKSGEAHCINCYDGYALHRHLCTKKSDHITGKSILAEAGIVMNEPHGYQCSWNELLADGTTWRQKFAPLLETHNVRFLFPPFLPYTSLETIRATYQNCADFLASPHTTNDQRSHAISAVARIAVTADRTNFPEVAISYFKVLLMHQATPIDALSDPHLPHLLGINVPFMLGRIYKKLKKYDLAEISFLSAREYGKGMPIMQISNQDALFELHTMYEMKKDI